MAMGISMSTNFDADRKVWAGMKKQVLYDPNASIGQVIYSRLSSNLKNIIQINDSEGITFTNEDVLTMSVRIALSLQEKEVKQTDFIGIMSSNTSYLMPLCYGLFFTNIPFHPVDATFTKDVVAHCWSKTRPKILFCDGSVFNIVKEVSEELKLNCEIYVIKDKVEGAKHIEDLFEDRGFSERLFYPEDISSGNNTAVVVCSSGSVGLPKAVTISHRSLTTMCSF
ncbi:hypothetical protein ACFFRR_002699 [Megaselia abdita]